MNTLIFSNTVVNCLTECHVDTGITVLYQAAVLTRIQSLNKLLHFAECLRVLEVHRLNALPVVEFESLQVVILRVVVRELKQVGVFDVRCRLACSRCQILHDLQVDLVVEGELPRDEERLVLLVKGQTREEGDAQGDTCQDISSGKDKQQSHCSKGAEA